MKDELEELEFYHRCIAARCRKEAASDVLSPVECRAAEAAGNMHERWAEVVAEAGGRKSEGGGPLDALVSMEC